MNKLLIALTAALAAASFNAHAHGDAKPMHGGVVQEASDLQFELVADGTGAALYVVDHGKPADTAKMSGKLTVLNGKEKSEAELKPAGSNKLQAADVKLAPGAKAVARVSGAAGKVITVRFTLK
jgi:hypothetical protein